MSHALGSTSLALKTLFQEAFGIFNYRGDQKVEFPSFWCTSEDLDPSLRLFGQHRLSDLCNTQGRWLPKWHNQAYCGELGQYTVSVSLDLHFCYRIWEFNSILRKLFTMCWTVLPCSFVGLHQQENSGWSMGAFLYPVTAADPFFF